MNKPRRDSCNFGDHHPSSRLEIEWSDVARTWHALYRELRNGEVVEVRQLPGCSNPYVIPRVSYVRTFTEFRAVIQQAADTRASIYAGINPRDRARYELAPGCWKPAAQFSSNSSYVTRRAWLALDCNPVRAESFTKFNADDIERKVFQKELTSTLKQAQLKEIFHADSGNGAHLLAHIDMPHTPATAALVEGWLKSFCKTYSGDHLRIDAAFDAAWIVKVVGTPAYGKFESLDRPARQTKWITCPSGQPVSEHLRAQILGTASDAVTSGNDGNVDEFTETPFPQGWIPLEAFNTVDVSVKLSEALSLDPKLAATWAGNFGGVEDDSKPALELEVAVIFAKRGFTPAEIFSALLVFPHGRNLRASAAQQEYAITIAQAIKAATTVTLGHFSNMVVLGLTQKAKVVIFVRDKRCMHEIDLARIKEIEMQLVIGSEFNRLVNEGTVEIGGRTLSKIPYKKLLKEMAIEARKTDFRSLKTLGNGIWNLGADIAVVGDRSLLLRKDRTLEELTLPIVSGHYLQPDASKPLLSADSIKLQMNVCDQRRARKSLMTVCRLLNQWHFKRNGTPLLLTALVAATWLQALWEWRPMVWLTAESGAGKSLLVRFLERVFGPATVLNDGSSTEAGLRQKLQGGSCPVLLDEFEANPQREKILELIRSSGRGGVISRGGAAGNNDFAIRHLIWAASVDVMLPRAADRSRWIVLELERLATTIDAPNCPDIEKIGFDFFISALWAAPQARELEVALRRVQIPNTDSRVRDNFIPPVAILAAIFGFSQRRAERLLQIWVKQFSVKNLAETESDQLALLAAILSSHIRITLPNCPAQKIVSVAQALSVPGSAHALELLGVRCIGASVFFAGKLLGRGLLKGTRWANIDLNSILARLPAAERGKQRIAGVPANGVSVLRSALDRFLEIIPEQTAGPNAPQ